MGSAVKLTSKVGTLTDIGSLINPGDFVAFGGGWSCNKPMAVVREIIRQRIDKLKVMSIVGGWEMEWLLASGCVDHLVFSFLSLEFFGLPANFRRVAEKKLIELTEIEGCSMIKGLEAARLGLPFAQFMGPKGSDIVKEAPELYKTVTCPFTGKELTAIQAIVPDVAVIHAQRADEQGNVQIFGTSASDMDMAMAARRTIVTVEEIVSGDEIRKNKTATKLFRTDVDMVIHCPFGASPCSSIPHYSAHLLQMMQDVDGLSPKKAAEYIPATIGKNEEEYWSNVGGEAARQKLTSLARTTGRIEWTGDIKAAKATDYDVADEMVVSLARTIDDGDSTVLGSFTPLAYAAYNLAKMTHAPNSFVVGYSGVDPYPFQMGFHTSEAACIANSAGLWSMTECIEALHFRGTGDVEAVSSAQMDANGDINISWLPMPIRDQDGKPTGEWNSRGLRLPGGAGAPVVFGLHRKSVAYFPNHSKMLFVPKVNYITGTRVYLTDEERKAQGLRPGPMIVVTNLCVMEMVARGKWRALSLHKGVTPPNVQDNTGFPVEVADDCPVTEAPTLQEQEFIRTIDPKGIRHLDFISGKERAAKLPAILQEEWDSV
ncbi:CoA-transferase [uncultured Desulfosarcina sp.]|uniref:CoA-transferase n=1 Tax=uncultured Desulfosarcina sp. TaxID=218289 RepID=UPI0029C64DDE|nr:CoA-transferase [uncultured Desulfosarcina sp.]